MKRSTLFDAPGRQEGSMSATSYPTGVENHGGSLRIWFQYKGKRIRENLGVPNTAKNRKIAGELRSSVCFAIRMGNFNYAEKFPNSPNLSRFGEDSKEITVKELTARWEELKRMEVSSNTMNRYESIIKNMLPRIGERKLVSAVTTEDLLYVRKELLTGYHVMKKDHRTALQGRKSSTVNNYMTLMAEIFQFGADNGYTKENPFSGINRLKKAKGEPDPLSTDEFIRFIEACRHLQMRNLWSLAVYTGMRHGELCGLAWEDIDLKAGTLTVRRNHTQTDEFTLPKTEAGTDRVIFLIQPAIDALKSQAQLTRLGKQYEIEVQLREYGQSVTHPCTFVFSPQCTKRGARTGYHYPVNSINKIWAAVIKRAGIRYRNAYQSRHTYACWSLSAGANPNFIATQMGHADAQMVYKVYGKWMSEKNAEQVSILNQALSRFAPSLPHKLSEVV